MKAIFKYSAIAALSLLTSSGAMADQLIINDSPNASGSSVEGWNNWGNYGGSAQDENGTPRVDQLTVNYSKQDQLLTSVELLFRKGLNPIRQDYDSLYINTSYTQNSLWFSWDHFIIDGVANSHDNDVQGDVVAADGLYTVKDTFHYDRTTSDNLPLFDEKYVTASAATTRQGDPSAIDADYLNLDSRIDFEPLFGDLGDNSNYWKLTYDFTRLNGKGLALQGGFFVAYTPWCANDVVGGGIPMEAVPEPTTMLLFGTGIAGLAGIGRRKMRK